MSKLRVSHLFGLVSAVTLAASAASAADLGGSIKDGPASYGAYNWGGLYIGAHAGIGVGQSEGSLRTGSYLDTLSRSDADLDGAIYGGQIGYNFQRGQYVFGVEGTFSGTSLDGNTTCALVLNCNKEIDWTASLVGRAGMAFDRTLVYGLGGVTWADVNSEVSFLGVKFASSSETHVGWIVGAGIEHALTDRISAKIEYTHADYGSESHTLKTPFGGIPTEVDAETDTVKLGLNIKLMK